MSDEKRPVTSREMWPAIAAMLGLEGRSIKKLSIHLDCESIVRIETEENIWTDGTVTPARRQWKLIPWESGYELLDVTTLADTCRTVIDPYASETTA